MEKACTERIEVRPARGEPAWRVVAAPTDGTAARERRVKRPMGR
jgi:hypothetical protein